MIDFEKLDLISSVNLRNEGKRVYQLIYGSQLYGTNFDVYAKFKGKKVQLTDGKYKGIEFSKAKGKLDAYKVEKISLVLLNYKGTLNLGFSGKFRFYINPETEMKTFCLKIQGANDRIKDEFRFKKPTLVVPKGETVRLLVQRILIPLPDFKRLLSRARTSPVGLGNKLEKPTPQTPLFDSEYFERDGVDLYKSNDRPGMIETDELKMLRPGGRCNAGIVSLFF